MLQLRLRSGWCNNTQGQNLTTQLYASVPHCHCLPSVRRLYPHCGLITNCQISERLVYFGMYVLSGTVYWLSFVLCLSTRSARPTVLDGVLDRRPGRRSRAHARPRSYPRQPADTIGTHVENRSALAGQVVTTNSGNKSRIVEGFTGISYCVLG